MQFQLEDLQFQNNAISSCTDLFQGQPRNLIENHFRLGAVPNHIVGNQCCLTKNQISKNKLGVITRNEISEDSAKLSDEPQCCIEMETGTGKTIVYIRTIYELYELYGFTKFIIIVPSIAIKEGIKNTLQNFSEELKSRYQRHIRWFEYDSNHLDQLRAFVTDDQPSIMITTTQAFTAEDRILNQENRDDSIDGQSYLSALGKTQPIIIMDEPQEGMDTEIAQSRLTTLSPLFVFRFSATHKRIINRIYRLTPAAAYSEGLVKKIEVLSVAEKNDEATQKIELAEVKANAGQNPKVRLKLWHKLKDGFRLKDSRLLAVGDNLSTATKNVSYEDFQIERIHKTIRDKAWKVKFTNGTEIVQGVRQGDIEGIFRQQLYWLIYTHFEKRKKTSSKRNQVPLPHFH